MTREEKAKSIQEISERLINSEVVYLADVSGLSAEKTSKLRRLCFNRNVGIKVVKNTLLQKAFESIEGKDFSGLSGALKGNTSIMTTNVGNVPAKLIKEFRDKSDKPLLKGAWIQDTVFIGDNQLDTLATLKSKEELIGDIIMLLQSPAKNVVSALSSGGGKLAGIIKTLSERPE
ncbi:MAG: 50S ribosomal protein L10 [Flavobacteriales bacterium]|nr:50S ribosomal protein L10 [Flavobacteriales bacterium]